MSGKFEVLVFLREKVFGRAHKEFLAVVIDKTRVFDRGRERDLFPYRGVGVDTEALVDSLGGGVALARSRHQSLRVLFDFFFGNEALDVANVHRSVGKRTRFIEADDVDARKVFE